MAMAVTTAVRARSPWTIASVARLFRASVCETGVCARLMRLRVVMLKGRELPFKFPNAFDSGFLSRACRRRGSVLRWSVGFSALLQQGTVILPERADLACDCGEQVR